MSKYTYNDIVAAKPHTSEELRAGEKAWIVGISEKKNRRGKYLEMFPEGIIYTIEFEDGSSVNVSEDDLILVLKHQESGA